MPALFIAGALSLIALLGPPAQAATFTVTNTNNSGSGSLRTAISNANSNGGTADTIAFNIPAGSLTGGVAVITITSSLPALTAPNTTIDGTTQTSNVGDTNPGVLGAGGTVGVDGLTLSQVNKPEIEIVDGNGLANGLDIEGNNTTVRGISIRGFGTGNVSQEGNIFIGNDVTGTLIEQNVVGTTATSFTDPGSSTRTSSSNIYSAGGDNGIVRNNLIGFARFFGMLADSGSTGWVVENNEVRGNATGNALLDGLSFEESGTSGDTARGNLVIDNDGCGLDSWTSDGGHTFVNNTVLQNGRGTSSELGETPGVRVWGTGNVVDRNIITSNYGPGILGIYSAGSSTFTSNAISANGTITANNGAAASGAIGIDLAATSSTATENAADGVTLNDSGDGDTGSNGLLNYPVLESAIIDGGNLVLSGFARPGSKIEVFIAAADPTGFGEGQTLVASLVEGSGQDADATTASYPPPAGVGSDTTHRFLFTIPVPSGVTGGTALTSTATVSSATSEFGNTISVVEATATPTRTGAARQPARRASHGHRRARLPRRARRRRRRRRHGRRR